MPAWLHKFVRSDWVALICLSAVWGLWVLTTIPQSDLTFGDFGWYMNRSYWLWHGYYEEHFVYTVGYPFILGFLNLLIPNIVLVALIWNMTAFVLLSVGIYALCKQLLGRVTAWIAVILIMSHWQVMVYARQWQTHLTFNMFLVWTILAYLHWYREQTMRSAMLAGLLTLFLVFVRFEGIAYNVLWIVGFFIILLESQNFKRAFAQAGGIALFNIVGILIYLSVLLNNISLESTGGNTVLAFSQNPLYLEVTSWRFYDLIQYTVSYWALWAILLGAIFIVWHDTKDRLAIAFLGLLMLAHTVAIFIFAPWASPLKNNVLIIFTGIFIAYGIRQLSMRFRLPLVAVVLLIVAISPSFDDIAEYAQYPLFAYQNGQTSENVADIEQWISETTTDSYQIFTLCNRSAPFFKERTPLSIYRFLGRISDIERDNSPPNLLPPSIETHEQLYFVVCDVIYYEDWQDWLDGNLDLAYEPQLVYTSGDLWVYAIEQRASQ